MLRKIIAILIGLTVYCILLFVQTELFTHEVFGQHIILISFVARYLYLALACFITGFIVQRKGWLYGLMVLPSLLVVGTILAIAGGILTNTSLSGIFSSWHWDVLLTWKVWLQWFAVVAISMIGGHLGQLLAQKWYKRKTR